MRPPPASEAIGDTLERGRASYAKHAWVDAHELLSRADEANPLGPDDLERLATSAYMLGRDEEYVRGLERAHYSYLDAGEIPRAAGCTWWIGLNLLIRGEGGARERMVRTGGAAARTRPARLRRGRIPPPRRDAPALRGR